MIVSLTDSYSLTSVAMRTSQQRHLFSSAGGTFFTSSGKSSLAVGSLHWQWECLVHFIPNMMEEEESRALQTINETPTEKAAKKRKLNEKVEDLKRHLEIVPNEDDDEYPEATPLPLNMCTVNVVHVKRGVS
nr:hypothetical protein [Tanacetum cinerariifolium]